MPKMDNAYPTSDQIKANERRFHAGRMEDEAKIRTTYGTPEDREHERMRVNQEWDKIESDKVQNVGDDKVWRNHLGRMTKMALSLRCRNKCLRRAKHFEMAGLSTAAKIFTKQAERLAAMSKKPMDVQKDILIDNLEKFSEFVNSVEKYHPRNTWEVWTRRGGERVTKIPSGNIVPYEGKVIEDRKKATGSSDADTKAGPGAASATDGVKTPANGATAKKLPAESKLNFKIVNGKHTSGHFDKGLAALEKAVRTYLAGQEKNSKFIAIKDMTETQRKNATYRKYNSGISQSETYAREYGAKGLGEKGELPADVRKFWLAMTLVMADVADEFGRVRDIEGKKNERVSKVAAVEYLQKFSKASF
jgi:hypothetical protein